MSLQKMISEKRLKDINIYSLAEQYKSGGGEDDKLPTNIKGLSKSGDTQHS